MLWIEQQMGAAAAGWLRRLRARNEGAATLSMWVALRERRRTRVRVPKGA